MPAMHRVADTDSIHFVTISRVGSWSDYPLFRTLLQRRGRRSKKTRCLLDVLPMESPCERGRLWCGCVCGCNLRVFGLCHRQACETLEARLLLWASGGFIRFTFARQAISMTWDFAECNFFSDSTGNFLGAIDWVTKAISELTPRNTGSITQQDAQSVRFHPIQSFPRIRLTTTTSNMPIYQTIFMFG